MTRGSKAVAAFLAGTVLVALVVAAGVLLLGGYGRTDGGHIAVVRNGGAFDNTKIRQVLVSNSGRTRIGLFSTQHDYPTSQRFFTISSTGNVDSNESVSVPTGDGVSVGIEGTAYFSVNTDPTGGYRVLEDFDNKYGTRQFRCPKGESSRSVWEGDAGFSCFLDQIVSPVINNDLRTSIGDVRCQDLVSSCALVQNTTAAQTGTIDPTLVGQGNVNLAKIETDISTSLASDLNRTLGGDYLVDVKFNLAKIDLDPKVQTAISDAQACFASVSKSQADLKNAQIEAQANAAKQQGYSLCPVCAQIDLTKALPTGITVYAPGNASGVALPVK